MKIACLGWGSLIWNPGELKIQREWFKDGPILPIELRRISDDKRMTFVIDNNESTQLVRLLWALMTTDDIEEAKKSLKSRESSSMDNISSITADEDATGNDIKLEIKNWLNHKGLNTAIWTGLTHESKLNKKYFNGKRPTQDQVLKYLNKLEGRERRDAEYYIRKAPKQIDTLYRRRIEATFGWTPVD